MSREIKSPCIQVCTYDEQKVCIGCKRTTEEAANWPVYSNEEKKEVMKKVMERRMIASGPLDRY